MELKIFKPGFSEKEFNDFLASNITYNMHFMENGAVYVMWKAANKVGRTYMEKVEELDKVVKQAESEMIAYNIEIESQDTAIADLKEKINEFHPNQKEWSTLNADITERERRIKMAKESIINNNRQVISVKAKVQDLLNTK